VFQDNKLLSPLKRRCMSVCKWLTVVFVLTCLVPLLVSVGVYLFSGPQEHWSRADRSSVGLAPDAARTPEAVVQAYCARTYGWRGVFGIHTWIAVKPAGALTWERMEVVGFGVSRGRPAVRIGAGVPDGRWYGQNPTLIGELRGSEAERAIEHLRNAANDYPYRNRYTVWPGPNSNTFTAHLARRVPELRMDLPANAVGKNYPVDGVLARTPSGTGWQVSLLGLAGIAVGKEEGLELDLMGVCIGVDFARPSLRLPGLGRLGMSKGITARPAPAPAPSVPGGN
jgi:hypothetical protein